MTRSGLWTVVLIVTSIDWDQWRQCTRVLCTTGHKEDMWDEVIGSLLCKLDESIFVTLFWESCIFDLWSTSRGRPYWTPSPSEVTYVVYISNSVYLILFINLLSNILQVIYCLSQTCVWLVGDKLRLFHLIYHINNVQLYLPQNIFCHAHLIKVKYKLEVLIDLFIVA